MVPGGRRRRGCSFRGWVFLDVEIVARLAAALLLPLAFLQARIVHVEKDALRIARNKKRVQIQLLDFRSQSQEGEDDGTVVVLRTQ